MERTTGWTEMVPLGVVIELEAQGAAGNLVYAASAIPGTPTAFSQNNLIKFT